MVNDTTVARQKVTIVDADNPANHLTPNFMYSQAITKSDSTVYSPPLEGLYVGGTGNVALQLAGDTQPQTFVGLPAGFQFLGYLIVKVMATNTTASNLIGLS